MKNLYDIIKFSVVTEKSTKIAPENNQFVFKVSLDSLRNKKCY